MKTFFLCWDNTNFKLYLIRTNLNCPLSPLPSFCIFKIDFFSFEKTPPQPAAMHDPNSKLALIQICNSICVKKVRKKMEKRKNFCRRISVDIPNFWTKSLFAWNVSYFPLWQNLLRTNRRELLFNAIISPKRIFYLQRKIM